MPKYHVQQEFYPPREVQTLDLTEEEETKLREQDGGRGVARWQRRVFRAREREPVEY